MDITKFSLNNKVLLCTILILAGLFGVKTYVSLPRAEDPGFNIRKAYITTFYPGASTEEIEQLITDPIEEILEEIEEIDYIESKSRRNVSVVEVNIDEKYRNLRDYWDEIRRKVHDVTPNLPRGISGPFINDDFGDVYGTVLMLTGEGYALSELEEIAEEIKHELFKLKDVGKVQLVGMPEQRVHVTYDKAKLSAVGLTPRGLAGFIRSRNEMSHAGFMTTEREHIDVVVGGAFTNINDIREMLIPLPHGGHARLEELATVSRGYAEPQKISASFMGEEALAIGIAMHPEGRITKLGPKIMEIAQKMQDKYPLGLELHRLAFQSEYVRKNLDGFVSSLFQGITLVFGVMVIALGLRTGVFVAAVIPLTMCITFIVMNAMGITLNKTSLAALILSLGLLVDNAIVVSESIAVQIDGGKSPFKAAVDAVKELRFPLFVASGTTVAALLPTYIAESRVSEYTSAMFEVVTISVVTSWILSQTMIPAMCATFYRTSKKKKTKSISEPTASNQSYEKFLKLLLCHRWGTVLSMVLFLFISFAGMRFVPKSFFPQKTEPAFSLEIELPQGTHWNKTVEISRDVEAFLTENHLASSNQFKWKYEKDGIINWAVFNGTSAPRYLLGYSPKQPRENYAYFLVNTSCYEVQNELFDSIRNYVSSKYPEATARCKKLVNGPPVDYPVELRITGEDSEVVEELVERTKKVFSETPWLTNINDSWGIHQETIVMDVDEAALRRSGLSHMDLSEAMQAHLSGYILDIYREDDDLIPIVLRSDEAVEEGLEALELLTVVNQRGESIPIENVADFRVEIQPPEVVRRNRMPTISVRADIQHDAPLSVTPFSLAAIIESKLKAEENWPEGYTYEFGGDVEMSGKAQNAIRAKQPWALLIIVLLLIAQFNALRPPLIVLLTLPFCLIGVILGLLVTQNAFGFMALLGVIALFGIVINNAIVLLDRVEIEMNEKGVSRHEAIINSAKLRFRPIMLTTATTVGGLIPLWLGGGPMFSPMAVAILFGLIISTVLTLGLAPVLYALFYKLKF
ncbi:MAG: efflux RND transporter permease subunit [Opitutales bacterium]|nr:efflux RND transporter permease subunit [Opitutales bacterium]